MPAVAPHPELKNLEEIRSVVCRALALAQRSVVFKSLRVGQFISEVLAILPNARFLFIRRDPLLTAQSLARAKEREGKPPERIWYLAPRDSRPLADLPVPRQIVLQIYLLDREILRYLRELSTSRYRVVWYHELCEDPVGTLAEIGRSFQLPRRDRATLPTSSLFREKSPSLEPGKRLVYEREVARLDWAAIGISR